MNTVYVILLVITFDAFLFLNNQKKFKGVCHFKALCRNIKNAYISKTINGKNNDSSFFDNSFKFCFIKWN